MVLRLNQLTVVGYHYYVWYHIWLDALYLFSCMFPPHLVSFLIFRKVVHRLVRHCFDWLV